MTIDLFRVFIAPDAARRVAAVLTPDAAGRVYVGEGARVKEFERELGGLLGAPGILSFSSCTAALEMALYLCDVRGGEVISTPITCLATNAAIVRQGARIVWADVDPETGLIDPVAVARKWTPFVKAVMAVDWGGRLCDYWSLPPDWVAGTVPVIEDAAHSFLAEDGANIARDGFCGDYVAYSFGPIKHLTTGGHGGALVTPPEQRERAKRLRWYGFDRDDTRSFRCEQNIEEIGGKSHMTDIDAAIGLANLPHARGIVERHRANARFYHDALSDVDGIRLPPFDPGSSYWLMDLLCEDEPARDALADYLTERGIETSRVHRRNDTLPGLQPFVVNADEPLPGVTAFDSQHICIPVGWWVSDDDREYVAEAVRTWARSRRPAGVR